ncbi:MAG: cytochrome C oxidase subunit IV family protein [Candidatus Zixiibacteriota bacterium]
MSTSVAKQSHIHILPLKVYLSIGAALLILTFITVEVSLHDFGGFNIVIALAIASIKALLVAFFFMHLWYDNKLYFIAFTVCLLCLTVFIVLTMFDTARRGDIDRVFDGTINPRAEMYNSPAFAKGANAHGATAVPADSTSADSTHADTTKAAGDSSDSTTPTAAPASSSTGH